VNRLSPHGGPRALSGRERTGWRKIGVLDGVPPGLIEAATFGIDVPPATCPGLRRQACPATWAGVMALRWMKGGGAPGSSSLSAPLDSHGSAMRWIAASSSTGSDCSGSVSVSTDEEVGIETRLMPGTTAGPGVDGFAGVKNGASRVSVT
jgi:hypothetical protein